MRRRLYALFLAIALIASQGFGCLSAAHAEDMGNTIWVSSWTELKDNLLNPPQGITTIGLLENITCPEPIGSALLSLVFFEPLTLNGNNKTISNAALAVMALGGPFRMENLQLRLAYDDTIAKKFKGVLTVEWGTVHTENVSILPDGGEHVALSGVCVANGATLISGQCYFYGASIGSDITTAGNGLYLEGSYMDNGGNYIAGGGNKKAGGAGAAIYAKNTAVGLKDGQLESGGDAPALWLSGSAATLTNMSLKSGPNSPAIHTESPADTVVFSGSSCASSWPLILEEFAGRITGIATDVSMNPLTLTQGDVIVADIACTPPGVSMIALLESGDPSIIKVGDDQKLHALAEGEVTITIRLPNGVQRAFLATVQAKSPGSTDPGGNTKPPLPTVQPLPNLLIPAFDLEPPEPFIPKTTTIDFYSFREDTPIFANPSSAGPPIGAGVNGDFAMVKTLDAHSGWTEITWGEGIGYIPTDSLELSRCIMEYAAQPATFVELDALYDSPNGKELRDIPPGIPVQSLITRGEWTALKYQDEIVYAPARNLRLLPIHQYSTQTERQTPLYLEPHEQSLTLTTLWAGVRVIFIPGEPEDEWILVKIGSFFGYVRVESLRWDTDVASEDADSPGEVI